MNDTNSQAELLGPETELQLPDPLKVVSSWFLIAGILLMLIGIMSIVFPLFIALAIETIVAVCFLFAAVTYAIHASQVRHLKSVWHSALWAIVYFVGGVMLFMAPMIGIAAIAMVLAVAIFVESVSKIMFARQIGMERPGLWILDGVVGIILAGMIWWYWPEDSVWIVGLLVGLRLVFAGAVMIIFAGRINQPGNKIQVEIRNSKGHENE